MASTSGNIRIKKERGEGGKAVRGKAAAGMVKVKVEKTGGGKAVKVKQEKTGMTQKSKPVKRRKGSKRGKGVKTENTAGGKVQGVNTAKATKAQKQRYRRRRSRKRWIQIQACDPETQRQDGVKKEESKDVIFITSTAPSGVKQEGKVKTENRNATPAQGNQGEVKDATAITDTPSGVKQERKKRKRKRRKTYQCITINEGQDEADEEVPAKKLKTEAPEGVVDLSKVDVSGAVSEASKKKRKRRKKKKGKSSQVGNASPEIIVIEDKDMEEELPAKRIKKETPDLQNTTQGTQPEDSATQNPKEKTSVTVAQEKKIKEKKTTCMNTTTATLHTPALHPSCTSEENKKEIRKCWTSDAAKGISLQEDKVEVIKTPFTCCYVTHLLEDDSFLEGVKEELEGVQLVAKNNDLYKFQQTQDLKGITSPYISALQHLLCSDVRQWLSEVTGITLSDTVDMSSSRYSHTDVLLCHDDELEGRRIAYILYLVPPWRPDDGGSLDLFSVDDEGHPKEVVRSLVPQHNAFAFFEVSPVSFHQVSEVLAEDKTRLSINGWFHGTPLPRPLRRQPSPTPLHGPGHMEEEDFYAWINPLYLDADTQKEIRRRFCLASELELEHFLSDEAYGRLSAALSGAGLPWESTGPPDRQCYEVLDTDKVPQEVRECRAFLQCEAFFLVLSQLTGLHLHTLAPQDSEDEEEEEEEVKAEGNPRCRVETQRWGHGCYTLIRDDCLDQHSALDAYLFSNVPEQWRHEMGGHVTYISKDVDEELLTVLPRSNCLSLVYHDAQTLHFTKHINATALQLAPEGTEGPRYHALACVYVE